LVSGHQFNLPVIQHAAEHHLEFLRITWVVHDTNNIFKPVCIIVWIFKVLFEVSVSFLGVLKVPVCEPSLEPIEIRLVVIHVTTSFFHPVIHHHVEHHQEFSRITWVIHVTNHIFEIGLAIVWIFIVQLKISVSILGELKIHVCEPVLEPIEIRLLVTSEAIEVHVPVLEGIHNHFGLV